MIGRLVRRALAGGALGALLVYVAWALALFVSSAVSPGLGPAPDPLLVLLGLPYALVAGLIVGAGAGLGGGLALAAGRRLPGRQRDQRRALFAVAAAVGAGLPALLMAMASYDVPVPAFAAVVAGVATRSAWFQWPAIEGRSEHQGRQNATA